MAPGEYTEGVNALTEERDTLHYSSLWELFRIVFRMHFQHVDPCIS